MSRIRRLFTKMCLAPRRLQFRRVRAVQKETTRYQTEKSNPIRRTTTPQPENYTFRQYANNSTSSSNHSWRTSGNEKDTPAITERRIRSHHVEEFQCGETLPG